MTTIETIAIIIVLIISLPRICKYIRRPSLLYSAYLVVGVLLSGFLTVYTRFMLDELGKIGFTLLLFLIGLEIDLPSWNSLQKPLKFCALWLGVQIPLLVTMFFLYGYDINFGWVAATGINACSLSIAYGLLKTQEEDLDPVAKSQILASMIVLEVMTLFIFASTDVVLSYGWGIEIISQCAAILFFIIIMKLFSKRIHHTLSILLDGQGRWKIHQMLLIILVVAIVGERIGLSAPKTAFFLGLFMSAVTHKGLKIEDELKPVAKGVLIPIFFLSLGTRISIDNFSALIQPISIILCAALGMRYFLFRYCFGTTEPLKTFLLFFPNITMASVAAEILIHHHFGQEQIDMLLMTSLILTVGSSLLFPVRVKKTELGKDKPKTLLVENIYS